MRQMFVISSPSLMGCAYTDTAPAQACSAASETLAEIKRIPLQLPPRPWRAHMDANGQEAPDGRNHTKQMQKKLPGLVGFPKLAGSR